MQAYILATGLPADAEIPAGVPLVVDHPSERSFVLVAYQPAGTGARPYTVTAYGRETPHVLIGSWVGCYPTLLGAVLSAQAVVAEAREMCATTLEWVLAREQFEQQEREQYAREQGALA